MLAGRAEWLDAATGRLEDRFGPTGAVTEDWPFRFTDYYEAEMGPDLIRRIVSFEQLIDPCEVVEWKLATNEIEQELAGGLENVPERPLNLDPGYVAGSKMVLATTKNFNHRIYLREGIYAEVTLRWQGGRFEPWEWTYPDYRTERYRKFFGRLRRRYMEQLHG
jgi:hypothetical protein